MIANDVLGRILYKHGYTIHVVYHIDGRDVPYWVCNRDDGTEMSVHRNDDGTTCNLNYTVFDTFNVSVTIRHQNVPLDGIDRSIRGLEMHCQEMHTKLSQPEIVSNEYDSSDKWV